MHCATRMPTSAESEITIPSSDCRNSRCMSVIRLAQCTEAVVLLTAGGQREQCGNPGAAGSSGLVAGSRLSLLCIQSSSRSDSSATAGQKQA